jgi:hypothetical protein
MFASLTKLLPLRGWNHSPVRRFARHSHEAPGPLAGISVVVAFARHFRYDPGGFS